MKVNAPFGIRFFLLLAAIAFSAFAFEHPLSSTLIREAYFLGTEQNDKADEFFAQYVHEIPEIRVGIYPSVVWLDTPFMRVARRARGDRNLGAQRAEEEFLKNPPLFRLRLDIFYAPAPLETEVPDSNRGSRHPADSVSGLRIRLIQNKKQISPKSTDSSPLYPEDEWYVGPSIGERVVIECDPEKLDSSVLTIEIETPDVQKGTTEFELAMLR
jgi:hypothetical protein